MTQSVLAREHSETKQRAKVLVIDDDLSVRNTFCRVLERAGYEADAAEDGKEALEKIAQKRYDVVLVDLVLPDMEGTEVVAKAKDELKETLKIILTGYPSVETRAEAMEQRIDGYLTKPVKPDELLTIIVRKLKGKTMI